jgi:flagellum-specific peptidoglycan hydrolase FlgJ
MILSLVLAVVPLVAGTGEPAPLLVEDVGDLDSVVAPAELALPTAVELPQPPAAAADDAGPRAAAEPQQRKLSSYTVKAGDTLSKIAAGFGLNVETLVWANDLADPDLVLAGSKLIIPPAIGVLHRVRPGDTVAELAGLYGSDLQKVIELNALEPPYIIIVGQRLLLPDGKMPMPKRPVETAPSQGPAQDDVRTPREGAALADKLEPSSPAPRPLPSPPGATPEQARFILSVADAARASQRETGVPASISIAQAILETFWGTSRLSRANNNYFGIKAKERPGTAGVVWFDVWEVIGGTNVIQREPFRAYHDPADSFVDHGRFFLQNPRYARALAARGDSRQFAREINAAGYATDPGYTPKLIGLMDRFNLYAYDE